ncbi:site-2 protease family protein [Undibacterium sp. CY18W]|uniref:Site-2 protease family protein n=1 Tax=Undibacterium hunanense TaxID=2762292 RepID=A0ABR6ZWX9_9BURK|nr:site-2 protease family protein [Undibacterium hunanense]MBC3920362.1 site-2 protease family protein [Undibacterium hunanense]
MDLVLGLGATFIAIVLLVQVVTLVISTNRLLKLQLWSPLKTPCVRSAIGELTPVLDAARAEMEQAGFRYMHSWRERSLICADDMPHSYADVYHHLAQDVHAEVYPAESSSGGRLYNVYLWNTYIDGNALLTVNKLLHSMIPYPNRVWVQDANADDFAGQLAAHLHTREAVPQQRTDDMDAPAIAQNLAGRWMVRLERENKTYQRGVVKGEPVYGFRFLSALALAWRMRLNSWRIKKKTTAVTTLDPALDAASLARDRFAFVRTLCTLRSLRAPRWYQYVSFTLSALAFLGVGAWWWGLDGALVVAAVIALHEGGHWLAMKLAGFRDVQVFFVPGMGGITSGEKHEARPLTHLLVYLAGPMPGLLLSVGALATITFIPSLLTMEWAPYLMTAVMASFFINGFNLLPVLPLDGGRVIELLIVGRLPWLRFIFSVASGGLLVLAGMNTGDNILRGLGILMLIGSPLHFRVAKASSLLLKQEQARPAPGERFSKAARRLYDFMGQASFSKWNYSTKLNVGLTILPRYLGRLPDWKESAAGLALYLSCIILPLLAMGGLMFAAPGAMLSVAGQGASSFIDTDKNDRSAKTAKTDLKATMRNGEADIQLQRKQRAEKIDAAQGAARVGMIKEALEETQGIDPEDALRIARLYYAENNNSIQPTHAHADAAFSVATALMNWSGPDDAADPKKNDAEIAQYLLEAEAILRARLHAQEDKKDSRLLAQVLQARDLSANTPGKIVLQEEVVTLLSSDKQKEDVQLLQARQMLAHSLYAAGRRADAETQLQAAETDFDCSPEVNDKLSDKLTDRAADNYHCNLLKTDRAWLMVSTNRLDEAKQLVAPFLKEATNDKGMNDFARHESHQINWMIATLQKDYKTARQEAQAANNSYQMSSGNWLIDLFIKRGQPVSNFQADLMLVHSQRALGEIEEAGKTSERLRNAVQQARNRMPQTVKPASDELVCRSMVYDAGWKKFFQQTLLDIEQREIKCIPRVVAVAR